MSLKSKFKTDSTAAREGVWFDYSSAPNADGSVPGFKLARTSKHNKRYTAAIRKFSEKYQGENGAVDFSSLNEEESDKILLRVFIDTVLLDWRNFQPDDDGKNLDFSKDNALAILGSDDWSDLYIDLNDKARAASNFRQKAIEAQAKN